MEPIPSLCLAILNAKPPAIIAGGSACCAGSQTETREGHSNVMGKAIAWLQPPGSKDPPSFHRRHGDGQSEPAPRKPRHQPPS